MCIPNSPNISSPIHSPWQGVATLNRMTRVAGGASHVESGVRVPDQSRAPGAHTGCSETSRTRHRRRRQGQMPRVPGKNCVFTKRQKRLAGTWEEEGQDLSKAGSLSHDFCTCMSWAPKPVFSWIKLWAWEASWEIPFQWKYWFMKFYLVQCNKSHKALQLSLNNSLPGNSSWGENLIMQCFSRVFSIIIFSFCVFMLIIIFLNWREHVIVRAVWLLWLNIYLRLEILVYLHLLKIINSIAIKITVH